MGSMSEQATPDPVFLTTVGMALRSIAREMSVALQRSAYSTILREAKDYATGLLDAKGQLLAQAEHNPVMVNSLRVSIGGCLDRVAIDEIRPGDALITNDPYAGGQHLPDIMIFTPIFWDDRLVGFAGSSAHHVDMGGGAAGPYAGATEIFHEGIRVPPSKVTIAEEFGGGFFESLLLANVREAEKVRGDLEAQLIANDIGVTRFGELLRRHGKDKLLSAIDHLLDVSETRTRAAIRELKPGRYVATDVVDDDGLGQEAIEIVAAVEVAEDELHIDLTGTSVATRGFINSPFASTVASIYTAVHDVIGDPTVHYNEGSNRPIRLTIREGTVVNPGPPAPVRARLCTAGRVLDVVLRALYQSAPDRAAGDSYMVCTAIVFAQRRQAEAEARTHAIAIEILGSAFGGAEGYDGESGIECPMENCTNTPVEALEVDFPFLRVARYELRRGSGGGGTWRGGMGLVREFEVLEDGVQLAMYADRFLASPEGAAGGRPGARGALTLVTGDERISLGSKVNRLLQRGERAHRRDRRRRGLRRPARS